MISLRSIAGVGIEWMRMAAMMLVVVAMMMEMKAIRVGGEIVNISNTKQRIDTMGEYMDVHDGLVFFDRATSSFLWFGMGYNNCTEERGIIPPFNCPGIYKKFGSCGFREDHAVRLYASENLVSWTLLSENVLPVEKRPRGVYFRPKVLFNELTQKYVLWINYLSPSSSPLKAYPNASYVVFTSERPQGPFDHIATPKVNTAVTGGGDFTIFIDPHDRNRSAYLAYDAWGNSHRVLIEKLTRDYTDSLGSAATTGPLSPSGNEAPILFERKGIYFLMFGATCCFCSDGSGSKVWTASNPMGPWEDTGRDINPKRGFFEGHVIEAQENFVITIPANITLSGEQEYVYTGDRWSSAPDKLKSHDFQFWQLLTFDDSTVPPTISELSWVDWFVLNLTRNARAGEANGGEARSSIPKAAMEAVRTLNLTRTEFGTYFREIWTSSIISHDLDPKRFQGGTRALASSIYNLYARDPSNEGPDQAGFPLHMLQSDETWDYYDGDGAISLFEFDLRSSSIRVVEIGRAASPHYTVPANTWVGALLSNGTTWALTGSTNVPAFDPRDSKMAADNVTLVKKLLRQFPSHEALIRRLTSF